jgi:hydroxymethylbilane synthase
VPDKNNHSSENKSIRIGTRESRLALLQTDMVVNELSKNFPDLKVEIIHITTGGDKVQDRPIAALGTRGVFVKELEEALFDNRVDLVVHSLKDLPTDMPAGLTLAAVLNRSDSRDVVVSHNKTKFMDLKPGSKVATSSRRRAAQLQNLRSDLQFVDVRGNILTRLRKHDEGLCDAMILAAAGLLRLELADRISEYLDYDLSTPAAGQGTLAVECRADDDAVLSLVKAIEDPKVRAEITAERAFLEKLGGGCSVPIGAFAVTDDSGNIHLRGCVASADGLEVIRATEDGAPENAVALGQTLAEKVLKLGAGNLLDHLRQIPITISPP